MKRRIFLGRLSDFLAFLFLVIRLFFTRRPSFPAILDEISDLGSQSLTVVVVVAVFVGSNLAIQGYSVLEMLGGDQLVSIFVGLAGLREMAPITAGAMVAAKAGSSMTATLATMRIKSQIDAIEVMAVDPVELLVLPKIYAFLFTLPLIVLIADFACLAAGFVISVNQLGVNPSVFLHSLSKFITVGDIFIGMAKGVSFGMLICLFSAYFGMHSDRGPEGIGNAANKTVISLCIACILANCFLTYIFYG